MDLAVTNSRFEWFSRLKLSGGKQDEKLAQPDNEELLAVTRPLDKEAVSRESCKHTLSLKKETEVITLLI